MKINSITTLARKLLDTTHPLVIGPNAYKSVFAKVVEGTLRRDYLTLLTTVYLAEHDEPEMQTAFGNSCMDLSRRVLEDLISLEYMLFKDKEAYAKKFFDYKAVEEKLDIDFFEATGVAIDQQLQQIKETTDQAYDQVKHQFRDSSSRVRKKAWAELTAFLKSRDKIDQQTAQEIEEEFKRQYPDTEQPRRAWAGLDTEGMIEELVSGGVISTWEQKILIQTYIQGNRKNHFSPTDIHDFLYDELYHTTSNSDLILSLIATTTAFTRIARIFIDEFDLPEGTEQVIEEIWQTIFTAQPPEDD